MDANKHEFSERGSVTRSNLVCNRGFRQVDAYIATRLLRVTDLRSKGGFGGKLVRVHSYLFVVYP